MHSAVQDGCLYVQGAATVHTVTASTYQKFITQCRQSNVHTLDLSGLECADSACVSLVLAALRNKPTGNLTLRGLPESVQSLAELYEIREWIHS